MSVGPRSFRAVIACALLVGTASAARLAQAGERDDPAPLTAKARRCYETLDYQCAKRSLDALRRLLGPKDRREHTIWVHRTLADVEVALGKPDLARAAFRELLRLLPLYRLEVEGTPPRLREAFDLALRDVTRVPDNTRSPPKDPVKQPIAIDPPLHADPIGPLAPRAIPLAPPLPAEPFPFGVSAGFAYALIFGSDAAALDNGLGTAVDAFGRAWRNLWVGLGFHIISFRELVALARSATNIEVTAKARLAWDVGRIELSAGGGLGFARATVSGGLTATGFAVRGDGRVAVFLHPRISVTFNVSADLLIAEVRGTVRQSLILPLALGIAGHF